MTWLDKVTKFWCTTEEGRVATGDHYVYTVQKASQKDCEHFYINKNKIGRDICLKHSTCLWYA